MSESVLGEGAGKSSGEDVHWLTVSDLMSGLMIIFLFLAIAYMRVVAKQNEAVVIERDRIKNVVVAWEETQDALYEDLEKAFANDLKRWNAEIDREELVVRFKEPEVLFKQGEATLQAKFEDILSDFFPRYVRILSQYRNCESVEDGRPRGCIEEIRIEGHTSSEWRGAESPKIAYYRNMALSQDRTRMVLNFCSDLSQVRNEAWIKEKIAAVGFSSSRPILDAEGSRDEERSRRVEFRVRTTIEKQLMRIIQDTPQ